MDSVEIKGSKHSRTAEELIQDAGREFGSYDSMMLMRLSMAMSLSSIANSLESLSALERNKQRRRDEI